jgi:uncharacterized protein YndB with AHSA1/START domain
VIDDEPLATFVDRLTMVYERHYSHPIEDVWDAVSTGEQLDVWMLPESRVERRLGGACAFGWGGSASDPNATNGEVTVFEPNAAIQYTFEDGESYMRFDLEPAGDGTRLLFTLRFAPNENPAEEPWTGSDLPAGPDTPWRPGFVAGYHEFLDDLYGYLQGEWTASDRAAHLAGEHQDRHVHWVDIYRSHIANECPPS